MAWKPGETGNPNGARRPMRFLAALERALLADDSKRLRAAAEKLLDLAAEGEAWAISMLADRLDGKPTQQFDMTVRAAVNELPDDELNRIAAGSSDRTAEAQSSPEVPSKLH